MSEPDQNESGSEVADASAILHIEVTAVEFSPWVAEPNTGLKQREVRMQLRLQEALKGRVRQKPGEVFEFKTAQRGTGGARVMDFYGVWSHTPLSAGASLLAFCRGESDDARVLLSENHVQQLLPLAAAYTDTEAAVRIERTKPSVEDAITVADNGRARYQGLFVRFLWHYVRTAAIASMPIFDRLMTIAESPETREAARDEYLSRAQEELGLRRPPLRDHEIRLAQAMFRVLELPISEDLRSGLLDVYLPNLLGLSKGTPKYSPDAVLPVAADRARIAAHLNGAGSDARSQATLNWLRQGSSK